jgi:hypothetical protein
MRLRKQRPAPAPTTKPSQPQCIAIAGCRHGMTPLVPGESEQDPRELLFSRVVLAPSGPNRGD